MDVSRSTYRFRNCPQKLARLLIIWREGFKNDPIFVGSIFSANQAVALEPDDPQGQALVIRLQLHVSEVVDIVIAACYDAIH